MYFTVNYERGPTDPRSEPARVGWFLDTDKSTVIYDPPERVRTDVPNRANAKSAGRCPAVLNMENRYFMIKCPFDIHIGFTRDKEGKPAIVNRAGASSSIRRKKLGEKLHLTSEPEWRYPDRPMIQLALPYTFIADEPVYITQLAPFAHYKKDPLPGTIFGGRFPINVWPRPLMWAFEWHDTSKDLVLRRGEPLFYCQFEADGPDRQIQMVEAEITDDLRAYLDHISGAVNYVNQTFSLFQAAERVRPETLLSPVSRK